MELLLEAEKRGILPEDKKLLLNEARRRGLVPGAPSGIEAPPAPVASPTPQQMGDFEGLDNPITQGVADAVVGVGQNMVESFGRTLSGLGNTRAGYEQSAQRVQEAGSDLLPQTDNAGDRLKQVANLINPMGQMDERIQPLTMGASEDAGNISMILGPLVKGVSSLTGFVRKQFPGLSKETARKAAGEILMSQSDDAPIYVKNAKEAARLEKKFPGMKFTVGQSTGNPKALAAEKTLINLTDAGKDAKVMQQVQADEAIRGRLEADYPYGLGADDAIRPIQAQKDALTREAQVAKTSKERAAKSLERAMQPEDAGAVLRSKAIEEKAATRTEVQKRFGKIDTSIELPSQELSKTVDDIAKQPFGKKAEDYPSDVMDFIKKKITKENQEVFSYGMYTPETKTIQKPITFGDTIEIRSQVTDALRAERAKGPLANDTLIKRLEQLRVGTERVQEQGLKAVNPQAYKDYLAAKKFYATDYVPRFKQGATADVIRKTGTGDQYVDNALIGKEYFKPGNDGVRAAEDFQKTFGTDATAKEAIRDYAAQDMLKAAKDELTGEISTNKLMGWINRHRPAIAKYGLWDEFRDLTKASRQLVKAQEAEAVFVKSYASKLLGVDADKAVANVFTGAGKKDSAAAAREIMGQLKGDKKAIHGMQAATKDYIMDKIQSATKDMADNPLLRGSTMEKLMKDLDPALAVIYRDNPSKLTALKETRKALDILRRSNMNLTGSSETSMFIDQAMRHGIGRLGGPWANFLVGWAKKASNDEMNRILVNAYFNPEIAAQLINAVKDKTAQSIFFESMKALSAGRVIGAAVEEADTRK